MPTKVLAKGARISFELFGNWDQALKTFGKLGPVVKEASIQAQLKVGNEIVKIVRGHLRNQDLGWAKLDQIYAQRKSAAGLSGKILMSYKTYYDNIKVWSQGNRTMVLIGVKKGIYTKQINGKRSRLDISTIAAIHEFSSGKRLPRRQLWNPSITQMGGAPAMKKMFTKSLIWHLRKAGIPVVHNNGNTLYLDGMKVNPFK